MLLSSAAAFAAPCGKITHMEGLVDVLRPGKNIATQASPGDPVEVGDIYRARTASKAEVTFLNRNVLRIGPATRVEIKEYMVGGGKNSNVIRLYSGKVQAVSADDLAKRIVALAEGSKFEVHTENAVAGVRDTNMLVGFEGHTTTVIFLSGRGYLYNPHFPKVIRSLISRYISTVSGSGGYPTEPKPANDALIRSFLRDLTSQRWEGGPPGTGGTTGTGTPPGNGGDQDPPGTDPDPQDQDPPPEGPVPMLPPPVDQANAFQFVQDISLLLALQSAQSQKGSTSLAGYSNYWEGGSGKWSDGTKWSLGHPPLAGGSIGLVSAPGTTVVYDAASTVECGSLTIDSTSGGPVILSVGQGSLATQLLTVGQFNAGTLDLSGGGSVSSLAIVLGMNSGSTGTFNQGYAEGLGPTTDGGAVLVSGNLYIGGCPGVAAGGTGTYNLYSGSLIVTGNTYVGYSGQGYFNQGKASPGGTFKTANLYLGYNAGSKGTYNLYNGSLTVTPGSIYVGYNGLGVFYQHGGTVTVNNANSGLIIGSTGSYDFEGGQLQVAGTLLNNGSLTVNGNSSSGDLFQVGALTSAGLLQGFGTIAGDVSVTGGIVHPGSSPGVLTITGNYTQSAGTLNIDITNDSSYSRLVVMGKARLAAYLYVSLLPGAQIHNGEIFDIVHATLGLSGTLSPEGSYFTEGSSFYFSLDPTSTDLFLIAHGDYSSVPLPPGLLFLAPGLAGLAAFRRRFKK